VANYNSGNTGAVIDAQIDKMESVTASATELNVVDGVTAGTVTASKAVVVDASKDIDWKGGRILNEQGRSDHVANTMPAPYYRFDGVNDVITIADHVNLDPANGDYSITGMIYMSDISSGITFLSRYTDDNNRLKLEYDQSSGKLNYFYKVGGTLMAQGNCSWTPSADTWYNIAIVIGNGSSNAIYINGISQTLSTDAYTGGDMSLAVAMELGEYSGTSYNQQQSNWSLHNHALTATEVKELYSGASVPFKYKGANQTELSTSTFQNSGYDVFSGADANGFHAEDTEGAAIARGHTNDDITLVAGKRYRVSWDLSGTLNSGTLTIVIRQAVGSGTVITQEGITASGQIEFDALVSENVATYFHHAAGSTCDYTISNFNIVQIGAVAEYDGSGASETTWYDKSGNNLDGAVTGASLENKYTAIQVDNLKLNGNTITSEDTNGNITLTPNGTGYTILNGQVGLGTSSPAQKLIVQDGNIAADGPGYIGIDDGQTNSVPRMGLVRKSGFSPKLGIGSATTFTVAVSSGTSIDDGGTFTDLFYVKPSGNVGIGTSSPASLLETKRSDTGVHWTLDRDGTDVATIGASSAGIEIDSATGQAITLNADNLDVDTKINWDSGLSLIVEGSSGNVGIGTASPDANALLHIEGSGNDKLYIKNTTSQAKLWLEGYGEGTSNAEIVMVASTVESNMRGLGTYMLDPTGQTEWYIGRDWNGSDRFTIARRSGSSTHNSYPGTDLFTITNNGVFAGSASADISDVRLKENIETIPNALESINKLKGRTYTWKKEALMQEGTKYGLIAQELEEVFPDLVLNYTGIRYEIEPVEAVEAQKAIEAQDAVEWTHKPSEENTKDEIKAWMDSNSLEYNSGDTKQDLLDKIPSVKQESVEAKEAIEAVESVEGVYYKSITMSGIIPVLVEAVKELSAKVALLEAK
jgi:hypothetical protein